MDDLPFSFIRLRGFGMKRKERKWFLSEYVLLFGLINDIGFDRKEREMRGKPLTKFSISFLPKSDKFE